MSQSGDRIIGSSGHRKAKAKSHHGGTETRRSEEDREIGSSGDREIMLLPNTAASGSFHDAPAPSLVQSAWKILRAAVREIFDESAYERFLLRTRAPRSVESYRAFMCEKEAGIAQKPKCC